MVFSWACPLQSCMEIFHGNVFPTINKEIKIKKMTVCKKQRVSSKIDNFEKQTFRGILPRKSHLNFLEANASVFHFERLFTTVDSYLNNMLKKSCFQGGVRKRYCIFNKMKHWKHFSECCFFYRWFGGIYFGLRKFGRKMECLCSILRKYNFSNPLPSL